ncbi:TlpA family protein disulfide reductase [Chromohalobacter canadensis]|uniref:TlpA disulfide reductase family protein n=1 Tax=Chromohalobacter canadensis TaxID=141389 RepID=UPI0021C1B897|nr:TlpA disulfide reductase family protein [Chromohalobacter canadensis]MCT8470067.1 TlpA family protein disulfide reductase [Chromohalobacter canadensis]MCT8473122.1 TlpA family protein disulfide reductase [Chromohalobacter canadensis]MCT8500544.1 TlpA family protein disulfide reductase [Chromohalobacter canadensis]
MPPIMLGHVPLPSAPLYAAVAALALLALGALLRLPGTRRRQWLSGTLVAALIGARLVYIALHPEAYREAPFEAITLWQSGYHPLGALLGAVAWTLWRLRDLPAHQMRRATGTLMVCSALWWGLNAWQPLAGEPPPSHLPSLTLKALDGTPTSIETLASASPLIVVLWRSDCRACRRTLARLTDLNRDAANVVTVNEGQTLLQAARYLDARGASFTHDLRDPQQRLQTYFGMPELPLTLHLDAHGRLRDYQMGEISTAHLMRWLSPTT